MSVDIDKRIHNAGKVKVFVNRTFPLVEANEAMAFRRESKTPGKVVLIV